MGEELPLVLEMVHHEFPHAGLEQGQMPHAGLKEGQIPHAGLKEGQKLWATKDLNLETT